MTRVKDLLGRMKAAAEIRVQDVVPGRIRCVLYQRNGDSKTVAAAWRNNDEGDVSFSATGMTVESAEDIFGVQVAGEKGWYGVGRVPVVNNCNYKILHLLRGDKVFERLSKHVMIKKPQETLPRLSPADVPPDFGGLAGGS